MVQQTWRVGGWESADGEKLVGYIVLIGRAVHGISDHFNCILSVLGASFK